MTPTFTQKTLDMAPQFIVYPVLSVKARGKMVKNRIIGPVTVFGVRIGGLLPLGRGDRGECIKVALNATSLRPSLPRRGVRLPVASDANTLRAAQAPLVWVMGRPTTGRSQPRSIGLS